MVKVNIIGLDALQKRFAQMPNNLKTQASAAVTRGAQLWVRNAKRDAPVDLGVLRNSITHYSIGPLTQEIVSGAKYSAYLEWGTITRVSVPGELQFYAVMFKGRGIRKSGGIYPHPYFFKQKPLAQAEIIRMLNAMQL